MTTDIAAARAHLIATLATMDDLFDFAESLMAENKRLLEERGEYASRAARYRQIINRQAREVDVLRGPPMLARHVSFPQPITQVRSDLPAKWDFTFRPPADEGCSD